MSGSEQTLRTTLARVLDFVQRDTELAAELAAARQEFFGGGRSDGSPAAAGRFGEWFLMERTSPRTGQTPVERFREVHGRELPPTELRTAELLDGSLVGVFLVRQVDPATAQAEDILTGQQLRLRQPGGSRLVAGDTLVGRVFPDGAGGFWCSEAMAVQPGAELAEAFRRDVARNRARGVLSRRLSQAELEGILWGHGRDPGATAPPGGSEVARLEQALAQTLEAAGVTDLDAQEISAQLAAAPRPGRVLGPVLDQLAFDSSADLDRVQRLLLELWNAHHAAGAGDADAEPTAPVAPTPEHRSPDAPCHCGSGRSYAGCCLGKDAAARIEAGLQRGDDIEALFAEVEAMVGGDEDADDATDDQLAELEQEVGDAPADEGDLAAFLQEYAWETLLDAADPEARPTLEQLLRFLEDLRPPVRSVDFVGADHVRAFAVRLHLTAPAGAGAERVRAALERCDRFFQWVRDEQLLPAPDAGAVASELAAPLARADGVARVLDADHATPPPDAAQVWEVTEVGSDAVEFAPRGRSGSRTRVRRQVPPGLSAQIRPGDLWLTAADGTGGSAARIHIVPFEIADRLPA